jgi:hypothetical protein
MTSSPTPRPPLPALGLPRAPRRLGSGAFVAIIVHIAIIGAVIWERTRYLEGTLGDQGPRGGGGSGEEMRYVTLPAAAESRRAETPKPVVTEAPVPVPQAIKLPDVKLELTPMSITPVAVVLEGVTTGTGGGPGSGGGSGGGTGTGTGTHDGPGSGGGDGGDIIPPDPIGILIPPDCASGEFAVHFSIEATGRVSQVELEPWPKDSGCRREFVEKMRQYRFKPARTRDGQSVAFRFTGKVTAH